ncbi:MAG TPA: hypothetical protein PLB02_15435, partial [Thermoanaerobaculia bacterium]|nr:hypothetical protein [Thermoanaerobaculia bacterium]
MNGFLPPASPCPERETTARLAALRARDGLDPAGEALLARHLAACPACLEEAVPVDPTLLFVRLSATAEAEEAAARAALRGTRGRRDEPSEADLLAADVLAVLRDRSSSGGRGSRRAALASHPWLR